MNVRRLSAVKRVAHRSSIKIVTGNLESKSFLPIQLKLSRSTHNL